MAGRYKPNHSELQKQAKEYLQLKGWSVMWHQAGLGTYEGISDLSAIKNGVTIYVEIKTENDRLSKKQREFKEMIEQNGGTFIEYRRLEDLTERGI